MALLPETQKTIFARLLVPTLRPHTLLVLLHPRQLLRRLLVPLLLPIILRSSPLLLHLRTQPLIKQLIEIKVLQYPLRLRLAYLLLILLNPHRLCPLHHRFIHLRRLTLRVSLYCIYFHLFWLLIQYLLPLVFLQKQVVNRSRLVVLVVVNRLLSLFLLKPKLIQHSEDARVQRNLILANY